jgi:hypothetical protein
MLSQLLASIAQLYRTSKKSFYIQINRNEPKLKAKLMEYHLNAKICEQKNVQFKILKFALIPFTKEHSILLFLFALFLFENIYEFLPVKCSFFPEV